MTHSVEHIQNFVRSTYGANSSMINQIIQNESSFVNNDDKGLMGVGKAAWTDVMRSARQRGLTQIKGIKIDDLEANYAKYVKDPSLNIYVGAEYTKWVDRQLSRNYNERFGTNITSVIDSDVLGDKGRALIGVGYKDGIGVAYKLVNEDGQYDVGLADQAYGVYNKDVPDAQGHGLAYGTTLMDAERPGSVSTSFSPEELTLIHERNLPNHWTNKLLIEPALKSQGESVAREQQTAIDTGIQQRAADNEAAIAAASPELASVFNPNPTGGSGLGPRADVLSSTTPTDAVPSTTEEPTADVPSTQEQSPTDQSGTLLTPLSKVFTNELNKIQGVRDVLNKAKLQPDLSVETPALPKFNTFKNFAPGATLLDDPLLQFDPATVQPVDPTKGISLLGTELLRDQGRDVSRALDRTVNPGGISVDQLGGVFDLQSGESATARVLSEQERKQQQMFDYLYNRTGQTVRG